MEVIMKEISLRDLNMDKERENTEMVLFTRVCLRMIFSMVREKLLTLMDHGFKPHGFTEENMEKRKYIKMEPHINAYTTTILKTFSIEPLQDAMIALGLMVYFPYFALHLYSQLFMWILEFL
jgi:hypothetical protein